MMQFHALVLLVASWMNQAAKAKWLLIASILFFVLGIALFSFNIVLHQLASVSTFRPLIPFGGMAFVLGWVALAITGFLSRK